MSSRPGRFISLEGGEGAGKSTQVKRLAAALARCGIDSIQTREPGGTAGAEAIRALLVSGDTGRWDAMTETMLHYAARRDHVEKTIRPALQRGEWVISDRFADSTMAYQGYAGGLGPEKVAAIHQLVLGDFQPDLTIMLDLPVETGLARAQNRLSAQPAKGAAEDRYERMGPGFHEALRQAFHDIAAKAPQRCRLIDASGTMDDVEAAIWAAVTTHFGLPS
ncbi:MAG TPA: dTMP kinase [Ferrovibrio sp.]|uniref:dTMP kinase n=1 Tax=Ferrovibrio sp. TaxID=1917215 RepID=UPI002ED0A3BF